MEKTIQKYEVYATVTLPISLDVEATNEHEALASIQYAVNDLNINQVLLTLIRQDGRVSIPKVHDYNIDVESVFENE